MDGLDAASAAFEVGYESASQFNRKYSRFFGQPPVRDNWALRSPGAPLLEGISNITVSCRLPKASELSRSVVRLASLFVDSRPLYSWPTPSAHNSCRVAWYLLLLICCPELWLWLGLDGEASSFSSIHQTSHPDVTCGEREIRGLLESTGCVRW